MVRRASRIGRRTVSAGHSIGPGALLPVAAKRVRPGKQGLRYDVRDLDPGVLVLSGGDPMKRPDLFDLLTYARWKGIRVAMTPFSESASFFTGE